MQAVGIVGFVGDEPFDWSSGGEKRWRQRDVIDVAGREQKDARPTFCIDQGVDFRGPPATRAADRLLEGPPFPPAAERCALMWELSMAAVPMPVEPVKASNIARPMPCRLQRLKRR